MKKAKISKKQLEEIEEREIEFHDKWADSVDPKTVKVDAVGNACTMPETRYILKKLGKLDGRKILELGCGCGEASVYFAKKGASVTATDISSGMVRLTEKVAKLHKVKIQTAVSGAEDIPFADNSFDIVYAANVLHHVDIARALPEIKRVLKPSGIFVQWDPVEYNPAINIYRKKAGSVRTVDEHPIDRSYIKDVKKYFRHVSYRGFWLFSCWIFVKYYFIDKIDPNKERYWKKIIDDAENLEKTYTRLAKIDELIFKIIPLAKWWCWNMVIFSTDRG